MNEISETKGVGMRCLTGDEKALLRALPHIDVADAQIIKKFEREGHGVLRGRIRKRRAQVVELYSGKQTIAEFAENAEIIQMLTRLGVDYAQGYGVAQPQGC